MASARLILAPICGENSPIFWRDKLCGHENIGDPMEMLPDWVSHLKLYVFHNVFVSAFVLAFMSS